MKKLCMALLAVFCAIAMTAPIAQAAETKVQLHDSLSLDDFVAGYNKSAEYPVTDYSSHSTRGDYEAYIAVVDQNNIMLVNTNTAGLISNIILMHRGDISAEDQKKLLSIFVGMNVALGYPATDEGMLFMVEAFNRLDITSPEVMASMLERTDIHRDYTFLKSENPAQQAHLILVEAVVE